MNPPIWTIVPNVKIPLGAPATYADAARTLPPTFAGATAVYMHLRGILYNLVFLTMISTALADRFSASGARFAEYLGARTVASFGDSASELRALLTGCGLCAFDWHRKLVITGEDRVRWTNGMVTNNIRDLDYEHGNYSFVLNAQGRIQGDLTIYNRGEYLLATTTALQVERLKEFLDRFIVMDDVEITDVSGKLESLALIGPTSRSVLAAAGLVCPRARSRPGRQRRVERHRLFRRPRSARR
jgi:hypothetical protein